jgi:hypothetical protein
MLFKFQFFWRAVLTKDFVIHNITVFVLMLTNYLVECLKWHLINREFDSARDKTLFNQSFNCSDFFASKGEVDWIFSVT